MIAVLVARNVRHHRRLLLVLMLGLASIEIMLIQVVASLDRGPGLQDIIQMLPETMRNLVSSQIAFVSFPAAVAFGFQHPAVLVASVAFVVVAGTIPAGERESGILELVIARPLPRMHYLAGVLVLLVLAAVLLPAALMTGSVVGLAMVQGAGELRWTRYVMSAVAFSALLLALGGMTLMLSAGAGRRGQAAAGSVGLVLALYLLEVLGGTWNALRWAQWASPFHYFKPVELAIRGETRVVNVMVLLAVFAGTTAIAFWRFQKRDL